MHEYAKLAMAAALVMALGMGNVEARESGRAGGKAPAASSGQDGGMWEDKWKCWYDSKSKIVTCAWVPEPTAEKKI